MTFLANGCSGSSSAGNTVSGWFGGGSETAGKQSQVYYAAVEGLDVRADADASSKVVGKLRLREKVTRTKEKNGYSFVRARGGSIEGWVPSARLDWRAARATGAAASAAAPAVEDSSADAGAPVTGDENTGESVDPTAEPAEPAAPDVAPAELAPAGDETADAAEPAATAPAPAPPSPEPAPKKKGIGASVFDPY